jgi:Baseplate J-like protein
MSFITNIWARYVDRSYQQVKDSVLTRLGAKVPEITDHTENNPYVAEIDIWAGINEQLNYYIDNAGRESFLSSCRLYKSAIYQATRMDYKVIGNLPHTVDVAFTLNTAATSGTGVITIPAGTVVSNGTIPYVTQANATIAVGQTVSTSVGASQYTIVTGVSLGVSNGYADMLVVFTDKVMHDSVIIRVNTVAWDSKPTLTYEQPLAHSYVQTVDVNGNVNVYFGDSILGGLIPPIGQAMACDYKTTLGADGGVAAATLTTIVTAITLPSGYTATVTNAVRSSGGSNVENLASLKQHIPVAVRTLERAVTSDDYKQVAELCAGVFLAGVYFNCGKKVTIYIVPDGGGIAGSTLRTACQTWMNGRKMITTNVVVKSAGEVRTKLTVAVTAASNYSNVLVNAAVKAALVDTEAYTKQAISGTVYLSDLYQAIEGVDGVVNSVISLFYVLPYARPTDTTNAVLDWTPAPNTTGTANHYWVFQFIDSTHCRVIRDSVIIIPSYTVGTTGSAFELSFVINAGSYMAGNTFTFVTYPYNPRTFIRLDEPSLPVVLDADLTVTTTGGY